MALPDESDLGQMVTSPYRGTAIPTTPLAVDPGVLAALGQRYDLLEELGRGGMGVVFRARDRETGDIVALKILRPEIANNPELLDRFKAELLLARKVTHKNVCRVHELIRLGSVAAISMEYVEGESLRAMLRRPQGVSLRYALGIVRQVLAGLREAHEQGVVHRDLKPENILLAKDGTAKVMDFGLAVSAMAASEPGAIAGTPAYMSPEQAQGRAADARSDIYSLGLVLYELFCGAPAFTAESPTDLLKKQVTAAPPPPRTREPGLPDYLDRVILKCLQKNPAQRFAGVAELEAAIEEQQPLDLTAEELPVPSEAERTWRKADAVLFAAAIFGALAFLLLRQLTFPASKFALEIDSLAARREADSVLLRIKRTVPPAEGVRMDYLPAVYVFGLFDQVFPGRGAGAKGTPLLDGMRQVEPPLSWVVSYRPSTDAPTFGGAANERFVRLDYRGRVLEVISPASADSVGRDYKAPPAEQRRVLAVRAVQDVCGDAPPDTPPVEIFGGSYGAQYSASWPRQEVALVAEQVTLVRCSRFRQALAPDAVARLDPLGFQRMLRAMGFMFAGFLFVGSSILFIKTQSHRSPVLWKRLIPAALAGLPSGWVLAPSLTTTPPGLADELLGGLAVTAVLWIGIVAVEAMLRRQLPDSVATLRLLLGGKVREPAVGLSILRGVLMGILLAGLQTMVFAASLVITPAGNSHELPPPYFLMAVAYLDPSPVGFAMASGWPAMFALCSAIFHGLLVGFLCIGLALQDTVRWFRKFAEEKSSWKRYLKPLGVYLLIGMNVGLLAAGLSLHYAASIGLAFSVFLVPFLTSVPLAYFFKRHGALATVMAVATLVMLTVNFPAAFLMREVGNGSQFAVFGIWVALIAAACWIGFRGRWPQAESAETSN